MKIPKVQRDLNIELLRIILMMMIIYHHFIVHGLGLSQIIEADFSLTNHTIKDAFIDCFLIMPVNCFVFISGYYGLKFRTKTVVNLLVQTTTYSLLFYLLYDLFFAEVSMHTLTIGLFPISYGIWWYISTYFFLYLLSPLLNVVNRSLTKFQFLFILGVLTMSTYFIGYFFDSTFLGLGEGKAVMSFITIYFWGQAFNSYFAGFTRGKYFYLTTYLASSGLIFLFCYYFMTHESFGYAWKVLYFNNPLVLIAAISFFFFFKNMKLGSHNIFGLSASVLGVYLIHDHRSVRLLLTERVNKMMETYNINLVYLLLIGATILVFLIASMIEKVRAGLMDPAVNYLFKRYSLDRYDERINFSASARL